MLGILQAVDHRVFFFINNGWSCGPLNDVFIGLSELGGWTIALVAAFALASEGRRRFLRHTLVVACFLALASATNNTLKDTIARPRPLKAFDAEIASGAVQVNYLETDTLRHRSFPSGHSMFAFFLMTYLGQARRPLRPYALALAAGIAVSRVYVGAHFPFDCVAGAAVGAAWALLAAWALVRLERRNPLPALA